MAAAGRGARTMGGGAWKGMLGAGGGGLRGRRAGVGCVFVCGMDVIDCSPPTPSLLLSQQRVLEPLYLTNIEVANRHNPMHGFLIPRDQAIGQLATSGDHQSRGIPPPPSASAVARPAQPALPRFCPQQPAAGVNADTCVQPVAGQLCEGPSLSTLFFRQAAACGHNSSGQLTLHWAQAAACSADTHLCQCLAGAGNVHSTPKYKQQQHQRLPLQHVEHGDGG